MTPILSASRRIALIAALVGVAGCAGPVRTQLPDGTYAYRISCDGTARGLNYCLEKAGKSCGADGYTILAENGDPVSTSDAVSADSQALFKDFESDRNSILIRCGT